MAWSDHMTQAEREKLMAPSGWIGVDLDGTLAEYHGWSDEIGKPVPLMVNRVRDWIAQGWTVKIFTARVAASGKPSPESGLSDSQEFADAQRKLIEAWCLKHIGMKLEVTATKDFGLVEFWDDRAVRVICNTGERGK